MSIGKEKSVINQQSRSLYALNCGLKSVLNEALTEFQVEAREAIRKLVYGLFEDEIKNLAGPSYNRSRRPELGSTEQVLIRAQSRLPGKGWP